MSFIFLNEGEDKSEYPSTAKVGIGLNVPFLLIYSIYIFASVFHCLHQKLFKRFNVLIYWLDYGYLLLLLIIHTILYISALVKLKNGEDKPECQKDTLCQSINSMLALINIFVSCQIIMNIIESLGICVSMNKVKHIHARDEKELNNRLGHLKIQKSPSYKMHLIEFGFVILIQTLAIVRLITNVKNKNEKRIKLFFKVAFIVLIISTIILGITLKAMTNYKKKLLENNFYNKNLVMIAEYNVSCARMIFCNDFITYKSICDFMGSFPAFMFYCFEKLGMATYFCCNIIFVIYIFFIGAIYLYVDKTNKVPNELILKKLYLLKCFKLSFGEKERAKLFDEFLLDQACDETKIMNMTSLAQILDD